LDKFSTYIYGNDGKIKDSKDIEEVVKEFLSDPVNENLVKSKIKVGGPGHMESNGENQDDSNKNGQKKKPTPGTYDANDPDLKREADMKGMTVQELIEIKKMRDAKLHPKKDKE